MTSTKEKFLISIILTIFTLFNGSCSMFFYQVTQSDNDTMSVSQLTQYGITWYFDKEYDIGQFINGDFFIIDDGSGVNIVDIDPQPSYVDNNGSITARNGSMINPRSGYTYGQAYGSNINDFKKSLWIGNSFTLYGNDSLISTISTEDSTAGVGWDGGKPISKSKLQTAAVLTCLSKEEVPEDPSNTFRPTYMGETKTQYVFSESMVTDLPSVELPTIVPNAGKFDNYMDYLARGMKRPWINHGTNQATYPMNPYENMFAYHREVAAFLNKASLILLSNTPYDKKDLLINYLQVGIDEYGVYTNGSARGTFFTWPLIFTGIVLDEPDIYNLFLDGRNTTITRSMDKCYYWEDHESTIKSSIVTEGYTWTGATAFFRKSDDNFEYEHLHPSEWNLTDDVYGWKSDTYRINIDSKEFVGGVLASKIWDSEMSANTKPLWAWNSTFDYVDRWLTEDYSAYLPTILETYPDALLSVPQNLSDSEFVEAMVELYYPFDEK